MSGDPAESYRRKGLTLAARLEGGLSALLARNERINPEDAATLARVITAILHLSTTATIYIHPSVEEVITDIREQIHSNLSPRRGDGVGRTSEAIENHLPGKLTSPEWLPTGRYVHRPAGGRRLDHSVRQNPRSAP